jgi:SAM-dependent methyltransferase
VSSSYRLELDRWLSQLDVTAKTVLDIGGSQLPVKGRTKSWDVKKYLIADLPEPHVGSPKPDIDIDMNQQISSDGDYDLIFCLEVFDYIYDPMAAMFNIERLLIDGGTAWVTFPSFYPTHNPVEDDALLYKEYGIRKLAEASGLKIVQMIKRRPETDALEQLWRRERMRAAKHYDHNFTGFICQFQK